MELDINQLIQYPQILELDRTEYSNKKSKILNINTAKLRIDELKSSIKKKISEIQAIQNVSKISEIINLLIGNY